MKKYDVVATLGTYEKDGQTKYISKNVGSIINTKHGFRLKLDASFNPAGCPRNEDGGVWLALFEPKPKGNKEGPAEMARRVMNEAPPQTFNQNDEIPF